MPKGKIGSIAFLMYLEKTFLSSKRVITEGKKIFKKNTKKI